jgi:hypothetical protein
MKPFRHALIAHEEDGNVLAMGSKFDGPRSMNALVLQWDQPKQYLLVLAAPQPNSLREVR